MILSETATADNGLMCDEVVLSWECHFDAKASCSECNPGPVGGNNSGPVVVMGDHSSSSNNDIEAIEDISYHSCEISDNDCLTGVARLKTWPPVFL